jgi:hypothetical protein
MTDTPIIDAALAAANHHHVFRDVVISVMRAALPWDLPVERLEVMVVGLLEVIDYPEQDGPPTLLEMRQNILAAYRADPIMRELYPEKY